jgi:hypothetical protein
MTTNEIQSTYTLTDDAAISLSATTPPQICALGPPPRDTVQLPILLLPLFPGSKVPERDKISYGPPCDGKRHHRMRIKPKHN